MAAHLPLPWVRGAYAHGGITMQSPAAHPTEFQTVLLKK